ncbi:MAG: RIP metalloprotease RseP [Prevotellaceae bacterium]|nr:RIP metalloprotease RseP [Prevotellaceae bacterium]
MDINIIGIKALQLLCCFCLLVVLHECGHFLFCKLFGVRVEKFFIFYDPKFHLFSTRDRWFTRLFPRFLRSETEYGIGWLPVGGYVKIAGMIDESMDKEQMRQEARPDEFRSQKVWKRFLIMVGGVLVNLVTAFVIFSAVMLHWGEDVLPMRNIEAGFAFNEAAEQIGFRDGDIPVKVNGKEIRGYSATLIRDFSRAKTVTVLRHGKEVTIKMPDKGLNMMDMLDMEPAFFTPLAEAVIDSVLPGSPADLVGVTKGSRIMAVDGREMAYWSDYDSLMAGRTEREMTLVLARPAGGLLDTLSLTLDEDMKMGVVRRMPIGEEQIEHITYNVLTCVPAGLRHGWEVLAGYVSDLRYIFTAKGVKSVGSFITIGSIFPDTWDWLRFWSLTAFISIILAVMNILPIPALDGGHVAILLYEWIAGREPSERVMVWLEYIGLGIIVALMVLAFGNDIVRWVLPHFGI